MDLRNILQPKDILKAKGVKYMVEFETTMSRIHEHGKRVGVMASSFGMRLGLDDIAQLILYTAGRWHDYGKMMVNLSILNKPGKLTEEEFFEVKKHPVISEFLLRESGFGESVLEIVLHHHEDWAGSGYPFGLATSDIPFGAQILRICDVFDALSEQRLYKDPISPEEAIAIMDDENMRGKFNPDLYLIFRDEYKEMDKDVEETAGILSRAMPNSFRDILLLRKSGSRRGSA